MRAVVAGVVVGVFRKCIWCRAYKSLASFGGPKVCDDCFRQRWQLLAGQVRARGIVITESGRAAWRAAEAVTV